MTDQQTTDATEEIAAVIADLYAALGNRPEFDKHLDPGITIWESDADGLLRGLDQLDALRDRRAATAERTVRPLATADVERTDVWGDTAVTRYRLHVRFDPAAPPTASFRVTDVLRRSEGGWHIVHHHSEKTS